MHVDSRISLEQIKQSQVHLAIIGMGYVGLPLALSFAQAGLRVTGIDVNPDKVTAVNQGHTYIADVNEDELRQATQSGRLQATTDYGILQDAQAIIICVPTPLSKTRDPDISYIVYASDQIARHFRRGQLIVLESTTYPGTTEEILLPRLAQNGYRVGSDFYLAFSPERIDPSNKHYTVRNTPKVIGAMTPACLELAMALYALVIETLVPVANTRTAEMVKLLENTFRAVNIGLVNEMALMCDRLDIDIWQVIEAASTKPYGFMRFTPGPGLGGHCIPLDPHYLAWKMRTVDYTSRFIQIATEINGSMPHHVVTMVADALNEERKAVNGARVLVMGVAYKPNVSDTRESPAIEIIDELTAKGADVSYHDPHVRQLATSSQKLSCVELTAELIESTDCVLIITPHEVYDWQMVLDHAAIVIDTRNAIGDLTSSSGRIIKL